VGSPDKIAPGFATAADLEAQAEAEQAELTSVAAPVPHSALGKAVASVFSVTDAVLSVPFAILLFAFDFFYNGVQAVLVPVCKLIPRRVFGVDVFTANAVTFGRVFLVIPVAIGLSCGAEPLLPPGVLLPEWAVPGWAFSGVANARSVPGVVLASVLIVLHDFLDHVDGIVAKAQREAGTAEGDDPVFGGFIDAFIDKVFFAVTVWSALLCTDLPALRAVARGLLGGSPAAPAAAAQSTLALELSVLAACGVLIAYEVTIATVRVNDYFTEKLAPPKAGERRRRLRAAMEGKLKQKLTSFGLAFLALAVPSLAAPAWIPGAAWVAVALLTLACYMAHKSLALKLAAYPGWEGWLPAGTAEPA